MDKITVSIININQADKTINLDFGTASILPDGRKWIIHNSDPEAYNVPGEDPNIKIVETDFNVSEPNLTIPGYSILVAEAEIE
jgi:hypothetical protein